MTQQRLNKVASATHVIQRALLVGQSAETAASLEPNLLALGLDVRHARTALECVSAMPGYQPDVVIVHWRNLDVMGLKFLRMVRDARLSSTPFVIANAGSMELNDRERFEALREGTDAVLSASADKGEIDAYLSMAGRYKSRAVQEQDRLGRVLNKLSDVQTRFDSLDKDLIEARKLQQGLMRERSIERDRIRLSLILRSSGHVGGDLVGHFPINDRAVGFFALDVSGHGVSSALMTARLAGYLSASNPRQNIAIEGDEESWRPRSPSEAVSDLNQLVMEDLETEHYFTMLLGHVDPVDGRVTFAQAGHPYPVHAAVGGKMDFIGAGGLPVGLIPGADYEDTTVAMKPGERLFLLSDGFTEAELPGGDLVGDKGLLSLLRASSGLSGHATLEALIWDLSKAIGEVDFQDDLSGVLIEFNGNPNT